ncbi:hypothetical protein SAMN04488107_4506 [Geodermatophilus saharensis]|uniref:Uncharacterized protein n=1 Tax=Geodermatophilus saharensis TaxID=1137994 RepID=A0A239IWQ8_9ACTN|nr:hypothetical protein [Geodermatophilus saharensis]SNS97453.1 hypothetical protein SAMN04488107_4506 [Geodermatophilus saharensis]
MSPYLPVLYALVGALAGGAFSYWLQRPRVVLVVDNIRLTADFSSDREQTKVNQALGQLLTQYERDLGFQAIASKGSATEREYVEALVKATAALEDEIHYLLPRVLDTAQQFRDHLLSEDYDLAGQTFARNSDILWDPFAEAFLRSQFDLLPQGWGDKLPDPPDERTSEGTYHRIRWHSNPDYYSVEMPGAFHARFVIRGPGLKSLAFRLASALATRNRSELFAVALKLRTIAQTRMKTAADLAALVAQELDPYRRFVVEGLVGNPGRSSFSVSNRSKLIVEMRGYRSQAGTLSRDVEMMLTLGTAPAGAVEGTIDYSTPVMVQPGQSRRFTCVSSQYARNMEAAEQLLRSFEGGDRQCYLVVASIRRRGDYRPIYSRRLLFRDLVNAAKLPPRRSLTRGVVRSR